jgi:hypothetical protein
MTIREHLSGARHRRGASRLRRAWWSYLPACKFGAVRTVILTRHHVLKFPGRWTWAGRKRWWDFLLRGLLSNMQETGFAAEGWPELCPVSFSFPGGFLVVMPRARPLADDEWRRLDYRAFVTRGDGYVEENFDTLAGEWCQGDLGQPLYSLVLGNAEPSSGIVPAEYKRDSFGALKGRIVAVDYG